MTSVTVDRNELASAFAWIARALPSRPASPVMAGVKITVKDNVLTVSAFDYDQSAVATIAVSDSVDFAVLVSGRLTADLVKSITAPTITLAPQDNRLILSGGRSKFTLPLMPLADYPSLPDSPPRIGTIDGETFATAVKRVASAAGRDETLPTLTGILVSTDPAEGVITFAATDRYRLAVATVPYTPEPGVDAARLLVPAKALDGYAKTVTSGTELTLLGAASGALFGVHNGARSASTRMLDGEFPKYEALLPTEFNHVIDVDTHEVVEATRRVALVAERNKPVRCVFSEGSLDISVGEKDDAAASEFVDVDYTGDEIMSGFNPGYFTDGLAAVSSDRARIQFTQPGKPALLVPVAADDDFRYLLMPVRNA